MAIPAYPFRPIASPRINNQIPPVIANSKATKVGLAAIGLGLLYFGIKNRSIALSIASVMTLGLSHKILAPKNLNLRNCTTFPANIDLSELEGLDLSGSSITRLPEGFNPPKLKNLNLSSSLIVSLPDHFNPSKLTHLDLSSTIITSLPNDFNPPKLKALDLSYTIITSLPDHFNPSKLTHLDLTGSSIRSLPEGFCPPKLSYLDLTSTRITSLPESLLNLSSDCMIYLTLSNFANTLQDIIRTFINQEDYNGPFFFYSINDLPTRAGSPSLEEALKNLFSTTEVPERGPDFLNKLLQDIDQDQIDTTRNNLRIWIDRLSETASAKSQGKKVFFESVVNTLQKATEDKALRSVVHTVISEASTTCGDRVALSAMHLDMQSKLHSKETPEDIYTFLVNTVYSMDILETSARNIVPTLRMTDPLEVYLGLPVRFKREFHLDINIDQMLYFACAGLTEGHIRDTRANLLEALQDKDKVVAFLEGQPKWMELLNTHYIEAIATAKEKRDAGAENPETASHALKVYQDTLKQLSVQLIDEKGLFQPPVATGP